MAAFEPRTAGDKPHNPEPHQVATEVPAPDPSVVIDSHEQVWQRLISHTIPQDELPSFIETIFSGKNATDMADSLQGSDAQALIDVIDEARHHPYICRTG